MDTVYREITGILASKFEIETASLLPDASFEDLSLDSLAQVELSELLADRFQVDIGDDEIAESSTVADVAALLRSKGAAA